MLAIAGDAGDCKRQALGSCAAAWPAVHLLEWACHNACGTSKTLQLSGLTGLALLLGDACCALQARNLGGQTGGHCSWAPMQSRTVRHGIVTDMLEVACPYLRCSGAIAVGTSSRERARTSRLVCVADRASMHGAIQPRIHGAHSELTCGAHRALSCMPTRQVPHLLLCSAPCNA